MEILAGEPAAFAAEGQQQFIDLVRRGGEVGEATLRTNVPRARALFFLRSGVSLIGVAALKVPFDTYRRKFKDRTGVEVAESDYPYELGYVFVVEEARGQGHASRLIGACVEAQRGAGMFATTREDNHPMHRALDRFGFAKAGKAYKGGNSGHDIRLFVRNAGGNVA